MDFYDKVDAEYLNVIASPLHLWRVKLELLDHNENTIKCIEQDIDYSNAGNITCSQLIQKIAIILTRTQSELFIKVYRIKTSGIL